MSARHAVFVLGLMLAACSNTNAPCPTSPPADGTSCTPGHQILACEYGGQAHTSCTTTAECASTQASQAPHWIVTAPDPSCGTQPAECPATFGAVMPNTSCANVGTTCDYAEGRCGCLRCETDGGFGGVWACRAWTDVDPGCPTPRPRLGTACSEEGLRCDYQHCCGGPSLGPPMECSNGFWTEYVNGACACAISSCP